MKAMTHNYTDKFVYAETLADAFKRNQHESLMNHDLLDAFRKARRDRILGERLMTTDTVTAIQRDSDRVRVIVDHVAMHSHAVYYFSLCQFDLWSGWLASRGLQITN